MLIPELLTLLKTLNEQGLNPLRHNLFAYGGEIVYADWNKANQAAEIIKGCSVVTYATPKEYANSGNVRIDVGTSRMVFTPNPPFHQKRKNMECNNSYRIISERTYQQLLSCTSAIARHLDNTDGIEQGVAAEFRDVAEDAWNIDHDMKSGWYPAHLLPSKLPVGTIAIVSEMASTSAPDALTMALAIKAYPGVVVVLPKNESHGGYIVWSLVDAYAVTSQAEDYKDQWVLRRNSSSESGGDHFWGYRISYSELMERKKELTILR